MRRDLVLLRGWPRLMRRGGLRRRRCNDCVFGFSVLFVRLHCMDWHDGFLGLSALDTRPRI